MVDRGRPARPSPARVVLTGGHASWRHSLSAATTIATRAGRKNSPLWVIWPMMPITRTATASGAAKRAAGAGAKSAMSASGAGATPSSSAAHDAGIGSALTSAEIVLR